MSVYRTSDRPGITFRAPIRACPRCISAYSSRFNDPCIEIDLRPRHRHLLGIEGLSAADITGLLDLSEEYVELNRQVDKKRTSLRGRTQVNLFFEPRPAPSPRSSWRASGSVPTS